MSLSFLPKGDSVAATRCSSQLISFFHRFIFDAENIATPVSLTFGSKLAEGSSDPLLRVLQLWDVKHWAVGYIKHSTSQVQRTESLESDSGTESNTESNCDHFMMKTEHYTVFIYFTASTNELENVMCRRVSIFGSDYYYTSEGSVWLRIGRGRYFKKGWEMSAFPPHVYAPRLSNRRRTTSGLHWPSRPTTNAPATGVYQLSQKVRLQVCSMSCGYEPVPVSYTHLTLPTRRTV